jgi:triphosphoribosyl-dephospho-CoA synthetase
MTQKTTASHQYPQYASMTLRDFIDHTPQAQGLLQEAARLSTLDQQKITKKAQQIRLKIRQKNLLETIKKNS